ncbi:L-threonylcarbamoyladenylate synthase [Aurantiacibacter poecillastricola]|uniref:L-threonylcarbamoyladenylate synthase n=1 Tax=Aurantiacibacter poecillastricola TaxID=3064385 RepID=UPI00273D0C5E|nr:L-threonylcarbamoyladenylate synthase [Aurantiacibacter sp. 219JJ12-13]MDP5260492.1 L-threonylcarbamoyladenylate synthase [Aurantiacibacter sp. 219JJ12-13]
MSGKPALIAPDDAGIASAAARLREGGLVAIPTETVYGLAARADSADAVAQIYRTKGRPDFNPLIVHVTGLEMARELAEMGPLAKMLAERFWPGPLTIVLPLRDGAAIAPAVTAGLDTIALRQPAHPVAAKLLSELGLPLAAPSANRSNGVSPTRPEHVIASLGKNAPPVIDGGPCEAGVESTIVALDRDDGWRLLRPGPISKDELRAILGEDTKSRGATIEAPGQLARHYSPGKPVLLNQAAAQAGQFFIGFGKIEGDVNLSPDADLAKAAAALYAALHAGAASNKAVIAVAPIPVDGMGEAINDRLRRAAAR